VVFLIGSHTLHITATVATAMLSSIAFASDITRHTANRTDPARTSLASIAMAFNLESVDFAVAANNFDHLAATSIGILAEMAYFKHIINCSLMIG